MKPCVSEFLALIEGKYPHAKPRNDNEYAHVEDFKERHLKCLTEADIEDLLLEVLNNLDSEPWTFNSYFWFVDCFFPEFRYRTEKYISSGKVQKNLGALKNYSKSR